MNFNDVKRYLVVFNCVDNKRISFFFMLFYLMVGFMVLEVIGNIYNGRFRNVSLFLF